ncbi:MAG TPA: TonB-dependent receptor [Rhodothermales bacterium]|nr:TonB-dependent receptor [Rhodothermales bacterium]HRR10188.1 TonB-dependent receptor [Rhodothermales bacterium]
MKGKTTRWLLGLFCLCLSPATMAQSVVTGKVTSADDGTPLPGVTVTVKGTTNGVLTNASGDYRISLSANRILVFSFVGYLTQEVSVNGRSEINIALVTDTKSLGEVVVTGFGAQIKREVTGNIAKIKSADIQDVPVFGVDQAIQGKAAGVQVNAGSGKLGQAVRISVRGPSSVTASNQPLFVVDGIPITNNDLSLSGGDTNPLVDLNSQDIASIEVLKDASAGAIYGSRAANGVILITTKQGRSSGKTNVQFGYSAGNSKPTRVVKFLNTEQYIDYYLKAAGNSDAIEKIDPNANDSYTTAMKDFFESQSLGTFGTSDEADTDWGALAFQDAPQSQYDLSISGGNDKTAFYVSGQWLDQKGIILGNAVNRISGRLNLEHKASDRFRLGANMGLSRSLNNRLSGDRQFDNPMQMVALPPMTPEKDPDTGLPVGTPPGDSNIPLYYNPIVNIGNSYYNTSVNRNISNVYGVLQIMKGLTFRSEVGVDILNQFEEQYYNSKTVRNFGALQGLSRNRAVRVENLNTNNYFSYWTVSGKHALDATLGTSFQASQTKTGYTEGQDFPSDAYRYIASAAKKTDGSSSQTDFRFVSYFARTNYKLADKYLLGLSARLDGSSRFGRDSRYGFFPAASAGWVLSDESFLKGNKLISFLKLRVSYGITGNAEIGNFPQLGLFTGDAGYNGQPGQRPSQLANPNLSWETTNQADFGLDFGFFKNRINGEVDYYAKKTTGLLLNVNVPASTGFLIQTQNVGKLTNNGWEFVLNTNNLDGAFQWTTGINLAYNKNKITDLDGQIIEGGLSAMSRAVEGQPLGAFFTVEYAGVDPANGDALWYLNTKNADGTINRGTTNSYSKAQRVVVGSALPTWIGGVTNTFRYNNLELSVFFNGQYGNKINFYGAGRFSSANGRFEDNQTVDQLDSWTPTNTDTDVPQARLYYNNGAQASSRFIQDGSFLRLRTATLSYNVPVQWLKKARVSAARLYVSGYNLWTLTNYTGWDPEVNADDIVTNIAQGYDFYSPPQPKTVLVGINLGF